MPEWLRVIITHLERAQERLVTDLYATIAAPNTPTGAGVYADRCNPSDGPPASYELLSSRLLRPTPGWSESGLTCERSGLKRKKGPIF